MLFSDLDYSTLRPAGGSDDHQHGLNQSAQPAFVGVQTDVADFMNQITSHEFTGENDYLEAHELLLGPDDQHASFHYDEADFKGD
ncbi:hypothetical protein HDV00_010933, partial [Rhizophlyctis rosea]